MISGGSCLGIVNSGIVSAKLDHHVHDSHPRSPSAYLFLLKQILQLLLVKISFVSPFQSLSI